MIKYIINKKSLFRHNIFDTSPWTKIIHAIFTLCTINFCFWNLVCYVFRNMLALKRADWIKINGNISAHLELVYLVTALVPSLTACLASSPGNKRRTAV